LGGGANQAAVLASGATSISSTNLPPSMTFGKSYDQVLVTSEVRRQFFFCNMCSRTWFRLNYDDNINRARSIDAACGDTLARTLLYEAAVGFVTRLKKASSLNDSGLASPDDRAMAKRRASAMWNEHCIIPANQTEP
jgi:hypothetical protein